MGVAYAVAYWPADRQLFPKTVDKPDIKITVRCCVASATPPTAPLLLLDLAANDRNNRDRGKKAEKYCFSVCLHKQRSLWIIFYTAVWTTQTTFPSHSLCVKQVTMLIFPLFKLYSGSVFVFHINRITSREGAGANHIFLWVSLSPKPHLSQFLHRLL